MSSWLLLTLIAQILLAFAYLFDQVVVRHPSLPNPLAYAFWVTILSTLSEGVLLLGLIPKFGDLSVPSFANVTEPSLFIILASLISGLTFFFALYFMFSAFAKSEASDVVPAVGAVSAIFIFVLEGIFLKTILPSGFLISFLLLVIGTIFASKLHFSKKDILFSVLAGLLFGLHNFLFKWMLEFANFDSVFTWTRVGYLFAVIFLFLILPSLRLELKKAKSQKKLGIGIGAVIFNKIIAGIGGLLNFKAIELASASLIQALGGLQYLFIFVFVFIGRFFGLIPKEEKFNKKVFFRLVAILFIFTGFILLF